MNVEPNKLSRQVAPSAQSTTRSAADASAPLPGPPERYTRGGGGDPLRLLPRPAPAQSQRFDDKTVAYFSDLRARNVDPGLLSVLQDDLDCRRNEQLLRSRIDTLPEHRDSLLKALDLAIQAHQGQTQKRPQDPEGLDNIPYVNHPIQVANMAFERHLNWQIVEASILHDVVEDTPVTLDDLRRQGFDDKTIDLVRQVSRSPGESRATYLERVSHMDHDAKSIKCLDRFHNFLRAFSVKDPTYLAGYLAEGQRFYAHAFEKIPELSDMGGNFRTLMEQVQKFRDTLIATA